MQPTQDASDPAGMIAKSNERVTAVHNKISVQHRMWWQGDDASFLHLASVRQVKVRTEQPIGF
jgi:hypothetical protein